MNHFAHSKNTSISRSLMAGLACGIVGAVLSVAYLYFYRKATEYSGTEFFEPMMIFFGIPLLFIIAGLIYFEMTDVIKRGGLLFSLLFLSVTLIVIFFGLDRFGKDKQGLLIGMVIICGVLLSFLLPFLASHAQIFMDKEQMSESDD
jgi:drug/metabolite transporter (DMT)-like permease